METQTKFIPSIIIACLFITLAIVILIFAEGLRRWYSGLFFFIMGSVTMLRALYLHRYSNK